MAAHVPTACSNQSRTCTNSASEGSAGPTNELQPRPSREKPPYRRLSCTSTPSRIRGQSAPQRMWSQTKYRKWRAEYEILFRGPKGVDTADAGDHQSLHRDRQRGLKTQDGERLTRWQRSRNICGKRTPGKETGREQHGAQTSAGGRPKQ